MPLAGSGSIEPSWSSNTKEKQIKKAGKEIEGHLKFGDFQVLTEACRDYQLHMYYSMLQLPNSTCEALPRLLVSKPFSPRPTS